jgi:hypothetical protein
VYTYSTVVLYYVRTLDDVLDVSTVLTLTNTTQWSRQDRVEEHYEHHNLRRGLADLDLVPFYTQSQRKLATCADQLPNLNANTCNSTSCSSKDLEVVGASLEVQGCLQCTCGQDVTATLKLRIKNKTGSTRTSFGYTASLVETLDSCNGGGAPTASPLSCTDERCNDTDGIPNTLALPGQAKELAFGQVTFKCGSRLKLTNVLEYWTDASPKSNCASFGSCQNLSPKCGRPGTDINIDPPLFASATATCIAGATNINIDATVVGGVKPYTYSWSNAATTEDLSNVSDGAYTLTVTDAKKCNVTASVSRQNCCFFAATCKTIDNPIIECTAGQGLPSPLTQPNVFNDTGTACGTITFATSDSTAGAVCPSNQVTTRTYTLFDDLNANTSRDSGEAFKQCNQIITIKDTVAPVPPSPPATVTGQCASDFPNATALTATDACQGPITVSPTGSTPPTDVCANGIYTRTWTFKDNCNNQASVSQTITLADSTAPTVPAAPADVTVQCVGNIPAKTDLTATDNCGYSIIASPVDSVAPPATGCRNVIILRTWTFTDKCGNTASVSQTITMADTTKPVLPTPPAALTVQCREKCPILLHSRRMTIAMAKSQWTPPRTVLFLPRAALMAHTLELGHSMTNAATKPL